MTKITISGWWYTYPLENMSSSIGMVKFPTEWKNKKCYKRPTRYAVKYYDTIIYIYTRLRGEIDDLT